MVHVNVEAVCLAWVNVVPKSELFGEVAALPLGAVADVGHALILISLVSVRLSDELKRLSGTLTRLRDFRCLGGLLRLVDVIQGIQAAITFRVERTNIMFFDSAIRAIQGYHNPIPSIDLVVQPRLSTRIDKRDKATNYAPYVSLYCVQLRKPLTA